MTPSIEEDQSDEGQIWHMATRMYGQDLSTEVVQHACTAQVNLLSPNPSIRSNKKAPKCQALSRQSKTPKHKSKT